MIQPAALTPEETDDNEILKEGLQYPNADVRAVLDVYEKLTGKHPIYDNTVQGQVPIVVTKPIAKQDAIRIIETTLLMDGFTIIPGIGNTVKVLGGQKNARQFGPPLVSEPSRIPEGDAVISYLFKLDNADPADVQQVIAQYVAPSPYTSFVAMPKSQALLVTESSSVIRSLLLIIAQLDHPSAKVESFWITLQRADAKDIIEKLNAIFEKQPTQAGTPGGQPGAPRPAAVNAAAPAGEEGTPAENGEAGPSATLSEDSLIVGKIKLTADIRTNRIHVVTRPVNIAFITQLIAEYDQDVPFGEPFKRSLKFVSAGDMLDVIVKAITEPGSKEDGGSSGGSSHGGTAAAPVSPSAAFGSNNSSGSGGAGSNLGAEELSTGSTDTTPEARTVGNTKIIADRRDNAIIILGNREVREKILKVLDQIDVRSPQVMITAVIGELNLNQDEEFGVDYLFHHTKLATSGSAGSGINSGINGISRNTSISSAGLSSLVAAAGLPSTGGLTALIGATKSLDILVNALQSTNRFHVISRPMVFTSNNKKAIIASGEQVPVPGTIQSSINSVGNNNGLVNNANVEYKDVDLKLEVLPLINSDKEVTLDIVQTVNDLNGTTTIGGNDIPNISSRRIKTTVSVANEATVVLGGLVKENKSVDHQGLPILSKLPIIGPLFGSKKKTTTRTELIVLIRPTVTCDPAEAVKMGEHVQEKLNFPPDLDSTLDPAGTRIKIPRNKNSMMLPPRASTRDEK